MTAMQTLHIVRDHEMNVVPIVGVVVYLYLFSLNFCYYLDLPPHLICVIPIPLLLGTLMIEGYMVARSRTCVLTRVKRFFTEV
jgi:hypothetical protein